MVSVFYSFLWLFQSEITAHGQNAHVHWHSSMTAPPCSHPPAHLLAHIPQCPQVSECASSPQCSCMGCWLSLQGPPGSGQCGCHWKPESRSGAHGHTWRRSDAVQGSLQQMPCSSERRARNVVAQGVQATEQGQIRLVSLGTSCAVAWPGGWLRLWAEQIPHRRSPRLWLCWSGPGCPRW